MVNALLDYNYMMHGSHKLIVTMKYQTQHFLTADLTQIRGDIGIMETSQHLKFYLSATFLLSPIIIQGKSRVTVVLLILLIFSRRAV